jgi:hypothetical protein
MTLSAKKELQDIKLMYSSRGRVAQHRI